MEVTWHFPDVRWFFVICITLQLVLIACVVHLISVLQNDTKINIKQMLDELFSQIVQRLNANTVTDCKHKSETEQVFRNEKDPIKHLSLGNETIPKLPSKVTDFDESYRFLKDFRKKMQENKTESGSQTTNETKSIFSSLSKQIESTPEQFEKNSRFTERKEKDQNSFPGEFHIQQGFLKNIQTQTADYVTDLKEDRDYDEQRKVFSNSYHSYCDADFNSLVGGSTEFSSNCTFDFSIPGNMNDSWLISNKDHALIMVLITLKRPLTILYLLSTKHVSS